MNPLSRFGVVSGAVLLGLGVAAPAQAARYTHSDAAGDVVRESCTDTGCTTEIDSAITEGDIVRSVVAHRARKVVVRAKFRELSVKPGTRVFSTRIVTNEGIKRDVSVVFDADFAPRGEMFMSRPNGADVRCTGLRKTVDFSLNTIEVRIPRACLSRPRWVKGGIGYLRLESDSMDKDPVFLGDDAHVRAGGGEVLRLSPRVYRG